MTNPENTPMMVQAAVVLCMLLRLVPGDNLQIPNQDKPCNDQENCHEDIENIPDDMIGGIQPLAEMFQTNDDLSKCSWKKKKPCPQEPQCICIICPNGIHVECINASLTHIPARLPWTTISMSLQKNFISDIEADVLKNYKYLTKLDMSYNKLTMLKKQHFDGLLHLHNLSLAHNNLSTIAKGTFSGLTEIFNIDLSHNCNLRIDSLTHVSYGLENTSISKLNLTNIHSRDIGCVKITRSCLENLNKTKIQYLILDSNSLVSLDPDAVQVIPQSLKGISLRDNRLSFGAYITMVLWNWCRLAHNLEIFIMSQQNINHITDSMYSFTQKERQKQIRWKRNGHKKLTVENSQQRRKLMQSKILPIQTGKQLVSLTTELNHDKYADPDTTHMCCKPCWHMIPMQCQYMAIRLPKNLKYIDFSEDQVRLEIKDLCFCEPNELNLMNISSNMFMRLTGPIRGLTNLKVLDASANSCANISDTFFHELPSLQHLNLSQNFLEYCLKRDDKGILFQKLGNLRALDLSRNGLNYLPYDIFYGLKNLSKLSLANNHLIHFKVRVDHMMHLTRVDLQHNLLRELDDTITSHFDKMQSKYRVHLRLANNWFHCTCRYLNFIRWLSETKVHLVDKHTYTCVFSNGTDGNLTFARQIYERLSTECSTYTTLIASTTSILVLFLIIVTGAIVYRYRWNLQYMYYSAKIKYKGYTRFENEETMFDFDVFVSYCDTEGMFVRQQIIPELEETREVHLLIHERDFLPGNFVADNIMRAITTSRKVLIILSQNYLRSTWCRYEMNMARMEHIKTGRDVICVLLKESIPTRNLPLEVIDIIKNQTYVELPKEQQDLPQFWDRMKTALLN